MGEAKHDAATARRAGQLARLAAALAAACASALLHAGDPGFTGRVVLEVLDDIAHDHKLRLLEEFAFRDGSGRLWLAPRGVLLDGWSVPRDLRALPGLPLESEYRKAGVVHDFYSRAKSVPWREVHRMLREAALAEGIPPTEANVLYMTIYASGWRWESKESSCYGSCHAAAAMLAWRPDAKAAEIEPLAQWLLESDASPEQIDARVDAALKRPGPHLFAQVRQ